MNNLEKIVQLKKKERKLLKKLAQLETELKITVNEHSYQATIRKDCDRIKLLLIVPVAPYFCEFVLTKNTLELIESNKLTDKEQKQIFKAVSKWLTSPTQNRK